MTAPPDPFATPPAPPDLGPPATPLAAGANREGGAAPPSVGAGRLDLVRALADAAGADAALVTHAPDLRWAVGFTGSNGLLVVTGKAAHFVTDGRYRAQADDEVEGADVHVPEGPLVDYVAEAGLLEGAGRVAVQAEHLTVAALDAYREALPAVEFVPVKNLLSEAVAAKDEAAIAAVARAQALTCEVFDAVLPFLGPGVAERDIAAEIVYQHLRRGASAMSFEPIVASGPRGALPHARPSSRTISPGELVVIDMGCVLDGYCSDLTRTVAVGGEPHASAREAYETVERAQHAAIAAARAGMTGGELDAVARDVIEADGLGEAFSHSLGHGVGIEVHEWPRLSQQVEHRLPAGATVTIEPGVYLPDRFGIRIEDLVVLREGGADNLTPLPTDLLVV
ncbi:aminopeptidase P family protein [Rubrivirga sp. S365]|uniref:aminopeptidase P family protein n=1 Tax=Rubrivirga sp. S365 TaxID=3076080 RepID=UPI0028C78981|nr:aminopeptidase P family protein [Rubrivirga sp. S365]MDT7857147.1 aminopeptidase P family protein [Rubrivirga sp. S365]